jgi:hypothetical protein
MHTVVWGLWLHFGAGLGACSIAAVGGIRDNRTKPSNPKTGTRRRTAEALMILRGRISFVTLSLSLLICVSALAGWRAADEPKPKPDNTITVQIGEPVVPQKLSPAPKFWISDVTDRSGNAQPMLITAQRGGIFLDKLPTATVKEALEQSLKAGNLLAADAASADLVLRVYLFHFGLAAGSGLDMFGKVEFTTVVKNPKTNETLEVKAAGTSIANGAVRKKNLQKNVQENIEGALHDATRNLLRGTQLKEAVAALWKGPDAGAPAKSEEVKPPGE